MKKIILTTALTVFVTAGVAQAVPTTWTDDIDFNPDITIPPTHSYFHDISDGADGFSSVFSGGNDIITSFELDVAVYDDNVGTEVEKLKWVWDGWDSGLRWVTEYKADGTEYGRVSFGLDSQSLDFGSGDNTFTGNFFGALDIFHDGTLNVSVYSTGGDFVLDASSLTVYGDDGSAPVPEPSTMLLFGAGLAGLVGYGRKRSNKKA